MIPLPARARTLSQAVTEAVLERIRAGEFRPGDRLPSEKSLMAEYGVGRNAAREAMQALVAMGLIDVRPGRGATLLTVESSGVDTATVAALLGDQAVEDLYEFRRLLEVEIARQAAGRATEEQVEAIDLALVRYRRAAMRSGRGASVSDFDYEFHAAVALASNNAVFAVVLDAISELIASARQLSLGVQWSIDRALVEHEAIAAAIAAHDPERAAAEMTTHLDGAILAIKEALAEGQGPAPADDSPPLPAGPERLGAEG